MLKKVTRDNLDINLAILAWHNTPTEGSVYSPVQKLQSRRTRTQLPISSELLKPEVAKGIVVETQHRKDKAKQQYDKTAKELPELVVGQSVRIQPTKHRALWKKAMVMKKVGIRSYLVKTNEGQIYRRNRKHLRQTAEKPLDTVATVPQGVEDETTIATNAPQEQTRENEPNIPQRMCQMTTR